MEQLSDARMFGGHQRVYRHASEACGCDMRFGLYLPPQAAERRVPVLTWLSGLTCTEENFVVKAGAQRAAAAAGVAILAPDTSPRGEGVADDEAYDLGQGAGFYVNATQAPWTPHFRMYDYVACELQSSLGEFPLDLSRQGIFGHSMGGHGALTLHLRHPDLYRTVSAFAPIVGPAEVPWGEKAFTAYLGDDRSAWAEHDACQLVARQPSQAHILVDQGDADSFLEGQLQPERFEAACKAAGQALTLRMQSGYDHSYFFIATFIDEHIAHHAKALG